MMKLVIKYIVLFGYFLLAFFLLGLIVKVVIGFLHTGEFYLPYDSIISNFFKSIIAASAILLAAIVFNIIDYVRTRAFPPSDSK